MTTTTASPGCSRVSSIASSFTLAVPDDDLESLQDKLGHTRLPDEIDDAGWRYGVPLAHINRLLAHWRDNFDWRKAEARINTLPMFTQDIQVDGFGSLNIHFLHRKSPVPTAIPLLFCHGWPGHFLEVRKILPLLTAASPHHPSFHVVAPSLPGFGFSEAPHKAGFAGYQYAEVLNKLMLSLGYEEYVYQGGDWGHLLGIYTVNRYGHKHVKAWHSNMPIFRSPTFFSHPIHYLERLAYPINTSLRSQLKPALRFRQRGSGYFVLQATTPQTIGYSLADSPVGLLAWIYEKLYRASDAYPFTDDEVIEWISIYWFSRAGPAASTRIYHEVTNGNENDLYQGTSWTSVPLGVSYFHKEILTMPKKWVHTIGNLVFESSHDKGGHFAAFEQPDLLASDLRHMFGKGGSAYGVVPGKDGYPVVSSRL